MSVRELPTIEYEAQAPSGETLRGYLHAVDVGAAKGVLEGLQLRIISLNIAPNAKRRVIGTDDFISFNEHLARLTASGLPIERGLRLISQDLASGRLRKTVDAVAEELERGTPLAQAFEHHRAGFPSLYGRLLDAGARSGNRSAILFNLGRHLELLTRMRRAIWQAVSYPLMVLVSMALVITFLSIVALPRFEEIYSDFRTSLPFITQCLLLFGHLAPIVGILILAVMAFAPLIWGLIRLAGQDQKVIELFIYPLPVIGSVLRNNSVARWCDALRVAVQSGMDLVSGMQMASDVVSGIGLRRDTHLLIDRLNTGNTLEHVTGLTILPETVPATIALASAQGELPDALRSMSELYQNQAERRLQLIPGLVTPILMAIAAGVLLFTIAGLFAPLIRLLRVASA